MVRLTGVRCGLDKVMDEHSPEIRKRQSGIVPPRLGSCWGIVEPKPSNNAVGVGDRVAVVVDHPLGWFVVIDTPIGVVTDWPEVQRSSGHHDLEPVTLVGQRQMADEAQATPARRQHRSPQLAVSQTLDLSEHVFTCTVDPAREQIPSGLEFCHGSILRGEPSASPHADASACGGTGDQPQVVGSVTPSKPITVARRLHTIVVSPADCRYGALDWA
jgi:hypothetical protein